MMKRLSALLPIVLLTALPAAASVTLSLDAGILSDNTGTPISDGDLVLLLASPDGVFTPTVGSEFVSGDDLILAASTANVTGALAMNSSQTTPGETLNTLTFNYDLGATGNTATTQPSIVAGDKLAIRWYTNFTLAQFEAGQTPTSGYYGTYTTAAVNPNNSGGAAWVAPTDGGTYTGSNGLFFFTSNDPLGGDQPQVLGEALTPVDSVNVPEPSSYSLMAIGFLVFASLAVRRKRLAQIVK